jgi:DHA1 family inner membrane transport protein
MASSAILYASAPNLTTLFAAALLCAFANAITLPVGLAIAATQLSERTGHRAMSYQIACVFAAVAAGLPGVVLLANALGWRSAFVILAVVPVALLVAVVVTVPVGRRDPNSALDLAAMARNYRALFRYRSLGLMYAFQVLYVICAFGSGAYSAAFVHSRGFSAQDFSILLAVIGVAFVASSLASGEILGRLKPDLRLVIAIGAILFCLARGSIYMSPLPFVSIVVLFAVASLCDGAVAVAMRSYVASHDAPDRTLSMVFFGACDSLGQALGGIITGAALATLGFVGIGGLAFAICVIATAIFVATQWRSWPAASSVEVA